MNESDNNQWYAHKKTEDRTLGPYLTPIEALAACFEPEITLSRGLYLTETLKGKEQSIEPSKGSGSFPCDIVPRERDYSSYK
jgi:hypothetical protein